MEGQDSSAAWPVIASIVGAAILTDRVIARHPVQFKPDQPPNVVDAIPGAEVVDARGAVLARHRLAISLVPPMLFSAALIVGVYACVHTALALVRAINRFESSGALDRAWRSGDPIQRLRDALVAPEAAFMPLHDTMHLIAACVASTLANGSVGAWIVARQRRRASVTRNRARVANVAAWLVVLALVSVGSAR